MAQIVYASTASFCVENARELGIPAALLLDKIVRCSKTTPRKDGFCWYTAKQFEEETSLKKDTFTRAAQKLEEAGIIERKVTYIIGTMERATHFKLLPQSCFDKSEMRFEPPSSESGFEPPSVNTIKYNKGETEIAKAISSPPQPAAGSSMKEVQSSFPFDDPVKDVAPTSLRPDKFKGDADRARRREFAIVGELRKHFGFTKGSANEAERKLVHQRLEDGWSKEEMAKVVTWLKENKEWYKDKPLQTCLAKPAFDEYQAANGTGNSSDLFAGMTDEQIHYWKMNHDEEYYEEFMRKAREAGNL